MSVFIELVRCNLAQLIGLVVYGLILIGLTALGYKVIGAAAGLGVTEASEKQYLFKGLLVLGLILGLSLIIAITTYEPSPDVILAHGTGTGGSCGTKHKKTSCGKASTSPSTPPVATQAGTPVTPVEVPPQ